VLAGCLLFAGKAGLNLYELGEQIEATKTITATDNQRYITILDSLPKISLTTRTCALIGRFDALQTALRPWSPCYPPERGLDRQPEIEWSASPGK
jgi:hypothetical protein